MSELEVLDAWELERCWEEDDRARAEVEWERRLRERLADRCAVPLVLVDSLTLDEVELLLAPSRQDHCLSDREDSYV